jgi:hypothetical protein
LDAEDADQCWAKRYIKRWLCLKQSKIYRSHYSIVNDYIFQKSNA